MSDDREQDVNEYPVCPDCGERHAPGYLKLQGAVRAFLGILANHPDGPEAVQALVSAFVHGLSPNPLEFKRAILDMVARRLLTEAPPVVDLTEFIPEGPAN